MDEAGFLFGKGGLETTRIFLGKIQCCFHANGLSDLCGLLIQRNH